MERTELELDMGQLILAVRKKFWHILLMAVLSMAVTLAFTHFFVTPKYQSSTILYITDTRYTENLEDNIEVILKLRESLIDILKYTEADHNHLELEKMLSVASVNSTEFIRITVSSPDPYEAESIANAIAELLPERISVILKGSSAETVEHAIVAREPSSPSYVSNALLGFALGGMLALGAVFVELICPKKKNIRSD